MVGNRISSAFYAQEIDLTEAHTNLEIGVGVFNWVQFWCDGSPIGITIAIGDQSKDKIRLDQFSVIPVVQGIKIWLTNDVRSGRSKLLMVFSRTAPLQPHLDAEQISRAELASRLGSIHTFDRRGEVLLLEDFSKGLGAWAVTTQGTGAQIAISNLYRKFSAYAAKFVTGNVADDYALLKTYLPYNNVGRQAFEVWFTVPDAETEVFLRMYLHDGTNYYAVYLHFDVPNALIQITTAGGVKEVAASLSIPTGHTLFHVIKCVADFSALKYIRLLWNNYEYDLSNHRLVTAASALGPYFSIDFTAMTSVNSSKTCYMGGGIITRNEP